MTPLEPAVYSSGSPSDKALYAVSLRAMVLPDTVRSFAALERFGEPSDEEDEGFVLKPVGDEAVVEESGGGEADVSS